MARGVRERAARVLVHLLRHARRGASRVPRILPGALVGVALWLAASAAFSAYLANFKSFNVTYGSFAAAIILLVWLWLTNVALLFGAEVNAEIDRKEEIFEGVSERKLNPPMRR